MSSHGIESICSADCLHVCVTDMTYEFFLASDRADADVTPASGLSSRRQPCAQPACQSIFDGKRFVLMTIYGGHSNQYHTSVIRLKRSSRSSWPAAEAWYRGRVWRRYRTGRSLRPFCRSATNTESSDLSARAVPSSGADFYP